MQRPSLALTFVVATGLFLVLSACDSSSLTDDATDNDDGANITGDVPEIVERFYNDVSVYQDGSVIVVESEGTPDHNSPYYDDARYEPYDGTNASFNLNPNRIREQQFVFRIPVTPSEASNKSATQLGLENCLFLDAMPKTELAVLLHRCDIGIMCLLNIPAFYSGTSPNKFFDYIAAGLPVINNYPGYVADMITEHGCGTAVAPNDPLAFADAVESLMADPARLAATGRASRRLAEQFSRKRLGGEFVRLLEAAYAHHLCMKN